MKMNDNPKIEIISTISPELSERLEIQNQIEKTKEVVNLIYEKIKFESYIEIDNFITKSFQNIESKATHSIVFDDRNISHILETVGLNEYLYRKQFKKNIAEIITPWLVEDIKRDYKISTYIDRFDVFPMIVITFDIKVKKTFDCKENYCSVNTNKERASNDNDNNDEWIPTSLPFVNSSDIIQLNEGL